VHANLIVCGQNHGVRPFFVQLRDLGTHVNLDGIETGDIGPTIGIVAMEEGWCRFNHRRIPEFSLLARFGRIGPDGSFEQPPAAVKKRGYS